MPSTLAPAPLVTPILKLHAPATWRSVDLISDLHLQASEASTFEVWSRYMADTPADAVLILGDLFEVWVGDDAVAQSPFLQSCAQVLKSAGQRLYLGLMHGNRDFLIGDSFVQDCHAHFLQDPTALHFGSTNWLLSHGDALCLADEAYQAFRSQVRTPEWRDAFLKQTLAERQAVARGLRDQSEARKREGSAAHCADADRLMSQIWLAQAHAQTLIHGHTHQPAEHVLAHDAQGVPCARWVLSDWDAGALVPRAQVLRLFENGRYQRLNLV
jgi:UDP-2,3-diacylglucosamine hydrolase